MSSENVRSRAKESLEMTDDTSATDVEESLLGNQYYHKQKSRHVASRRMSAVSTALRTFFYFSAAIWLWVSMFSMRRDALHPVSPDVRDPHKKQFTAHGDGNFSLAEDISGQIPTFDTEIWMFWNDSKFVLDDPVGATPEEELAVKKAWKSIVPEGNGFVIIDDPFAPILPPPINQPADFEMDRFCLTVWHQLHCLRGIQEGYYQLLRDPTATDSLGHVNHCINYLREGVMCYGDTALEGQSTYSSEERANGNAGNHVCKDFRSLLDWSNERSSKRLSQKMRQGGIGGH